MKFLGIRPTILKLLAGVVLNKMYFIINNSIIQNLVSSLTGCFKSASIFVRSVASLFHFTHNGVELFWKTNTYFSEI